MRWERNLGSGKPQKGLDQASMWLAVHGGTTLLQLQCAHELLGNLVKMHILVQQVWGGVRGSA